MSTHIDNAVRFASGTSVGQALDILKNLRPRVQDALRVEHIQQLTDEAVHKHDIALLEYLGWRSPAQTHDSTPLSEASSELGEQRRNDKKQYGRNPFVANATVFTQGRFVYALLNLPPDLTSDVLEEYERNGVWSDYSYWNNSDRPDHVGARQWARRAAVWDSILSTTYYPSDVGVVVQLSRTNDEDLDLYDFFDYARKSAKDNTPMVFPQISIPSLNVRMMYAANVISNAPWFADIDLSGSTGPYMKRSRELHRGENDDFNTARAFLEQHVFTNVLSLDYLFTDYAELSKKWETILTTVRALDVPLSLQTPSFQAKQLGEIFPDDARVKIHKI